MGLTSLTCYGWCRIRIAINQAWAMCLGHCRHSDTDNIVIVMLKFLLAKPGPQININPRVPWLFPNSEAKVSFASSLKVWSQRGHGSFSLSGTYRNSTLLLYSKLWNFPSKKAIFKNRHESKRDDARKVPSAQTTNHERVHHAPPASHSGTKDSVSGTASLHNQQPVVLGPRI